jgi:DUF1680 family protein
VVRQTTAFPETGNVRLEIVSAASRQFDLHVRHPAWAATAAVRINGGAVETSRRRGSFITLTRRWTSGDVIDLDLPMALRMERLPGTTDTAAVVYGPIVLVGALGHAVRPGEDLHVNERTIGTTLNEPIEVPTLAGELADIPGRIRPTGEPLTFRTDGVGRPGDVTLVPYYRTAHQHYNMYWNVRGQDPPRV